MKIPPFKIERYFARYEFSVPYLLSCSDCEPLTLAEVLEFADTERRDQWDNLWLGYTDSHGEPTLRNEIIKLYNSITTDMITVVAPIEGIFVVMNALLQKGDHCIVTFPGYQSLYEVARSLECDISYWKITEDGGWHFDVDHLASLITPRTKMIVINFPHNPTGATITKEQMKDLVDLARKHGIILFSDEMYRGLESNPSLMLPAAADMYENAISLYGMSKSFSLPGLRIGWLATQNGSMLDLCLKFKDYTTICTSAPSQFLSTIALTAKDTILQRNKEIIAKNTVLFEEFVARHGHLFSWCPPQAGSIAFVRYTGSDGVTALSKRLIEQDGIMIVPSTVFDYNDHHWRLGLGRKNIPQILDRLEKQLR